MTPAIPRRQFLGQLASGAAALAAIGRPARAADLSVVADRARALDQLRAIIVAQRGQIVLGEAFRGPPLTRAANMKSVSKTIVAALTGAAIDRGVVPGVQAPLGALIPRLIPRGADPRVAAITIEDLVTLRAGLARTSGAGYGAWVESRNWVAYALGQPMVANPGAAFLYSTGSTHVLGAAIAQASGRTLLALARDWIGGPLDIEIPAWTRDPQGFYLGGNEMALSPLALLAFGEAFRAGGGGIVSPAWVEASWTPRTRSPFSGHQYGYGWFLAEMAGQRVAYARGYGGQMLYVIPGAEAVVVVTSDPNRPARSDGHVGALNTLLAEAILPALAAAG